MTWTLFRFSASGGYQRSPIFGSMSTDHGVHWSTPEEISGVSTTLRFFGNVFDPTQDANACNFNQGSDPVVLPNGDLEVVFNNGNTPAGNPNAQQLGVHCHPSGNSAIPPPDGIQTGFNGDYSGLTINKGRTRIRSGPIPGTSIRMPPPTA